MTLFGGHAGAHLDDDLAGNRLRLGWLVRQFADRDLYVPGRLRDRGAGGQSERDEARAGDAERHAKMRFAHCCLLPRTTRNRPTIAIISCDPPWVGAMGCGH